MLYEFSIGNNYTAADLGILKEFKENSFETFLDKAGFSRFGTDVGNHKRSYGLTVYSRKEETERHPYEFLVAVKLAGKEIGAVVMNDFVHLIEFLRLHGGVATEVSAWEMQDGLRSEIEL